MFDIDLGAFLRERGNDCLVIGLAPVRRSFTAQAKPVRIAAR
jgi:hypothetical protein